MRRGAGHWLIIGAVFLYCLSLYPAILTSTRECGHDAPIYWLAGRGDAARVQVNPAGFESTGWVYSDRVLPVFEVLARLPYPWFLACLHLLNSLGAAALMAAALRVTGSYPFWGWFVVFVVGAKASDIVANGNITGLLVGMSLTPLGALLACAIKPHFALAVVLHAAAWVAGQRRDIEVRHTPRR